MTTSFTLDMSELTDYSDQVTHNIKAAEGTLTPIAARHARDVVRKAKQLVPVDTGALRASIRISDTSEAVNLGLAGSTVEAGQPYAGFVEYGTSRMAPQPFMRPAMDSVRNPFRQDILEAAAMVVYPLPSAERDGDLSDFDSLQTWVFQITSVGETAKQTEWMADQARTALVGTGTITVSGRSIQRVESDTIGGTPVRDPAGQTQLYTLPESFRVLSYPS